MEQIVSFWYMSIVICHFDKNNIEASICRPEAENKLNIQYKKSFKNKNSQPIELHFSSSCSCWTSLWCVKHPIWWPNFWKIFKPRLAYGFLGRRLRIIISKIQNGRSNMAVVFLKINQSKWSCTFSMWRMLFLKRTDIDLYNSRWRIQYGERFMKINWSAPNSTHEGL